MTNSSFTRQTAIDIALEEITLLTSSKKFYRAVAECDELLAEVPERKYDILRARSFAFEMMSDHPNAFRDYEEIIGSGEAALGDYFQGAYRALGASEIEKAHEWLEMALRLGEEQNEDWFKSSALYYLSFVQMELENYDEAEEYLDRAIEMDPDIYTYVPRTGMRDHAQLREEIRQRREGRVMTRDQFNKICSQITGAKSRSDTEEAYRLLDLIDDLGTSGMKANGYWFRGWIKKDQGLGEDARKDWMEGLRYARKATYTFFLLQDYIGRSFEEEGASDQAIKWYREALKTCAAGVGFLGQSALASFLTLNGGRIPEKDRKTVTRVLEKSWRVHQFPGEPNLNDLPAGICELNERFEKLVERTLYESMRDADEESDS